MTLRDDVELQQAQQALRHLQLALASLKRDVANARNFEIMAEGTLDEIARIQADVDAYLGVDELRAPLWLTLSGPEVHVDDAPASVMTYYLDNFRKGVQAATEHAFTGKLSTRPTAKVLKASEMRFAGVADGSLRIGLRMEGPAQLELDQTDDLARAAARSLDEYLAVAAWAGSSGDDDALAEIVPDAARRRLLLNLVMQLAPRVRGAVDTVEFRGRAVHTKSPAKLTRESRERLASAIDRVEQSVSEDHTGPLRELDLDKRTGIVRSESAEILCELVEELMTTAQEALGRTVHIVGSRNESSGRRRTTLLVTRMEILDEPTEDAVAPRPGTSPVG